MAALHPSVLHNKDKFWATERIVLTTAEQQQGKVLLQGYMSDWSKFCNSPYIIWWKYFNEKCHKMASEGKQGQQQPRYHGNDNNNN